MGDNIFCFNSYGIIITMRDRIVMTIGLVAAAVMLWLLVFTTPFGIGPFGVLVFFTMIYIILFGLSIAIQVIFRKLLGKSGGISGKGYLYATVVSFSGMLVMLVNALRESWMIAILAGAVFCALGCFLVNKKF